MATRELPEARTVDLARIGDHEPRLFEVPHALVRGAEPDAKGVEERFVGFTGHLDEA